MGRLGSALLKGVGVLVLALIVLSVIATVVGIALSVVAAVVSMVVSIAVLGAFVLTVIGLMSVLSDGSETDSRAVAPRRADDPPDPEDRLRSQYVAGELDDAEFERELERVLDPDERRGRTGTDRSVDQNASSDRERRREWERR
ncbi:SHOCT domain-containing protein [Natrinema amylolyticum]|uniref:SHOCT domain-containing protein n=1 Tax=Natrinema amylolyticum TaxID=2878679 RepID=UPI001CFC44B9|nr:SHOCT domain-containing protein [Natrinema amylolyticum]